MADQHTPALPRVTDAMIDAAARYAPAGSRDLARAALDAALAVSDIHSPFNACMHQEHCKRLEQQRDELLQALQGLRNAQSRYYTEKARWWQDDGAEREAAFVALSEAEAAADVAIAKVKEATHG